MKLTKSFTKLTGIFLVLSLILLFFMAACATVTPPPRPTVQDKATVPAPKKPQVVKPSAEALKPLAQVKPQIASEEKMPFEGEVFSLSARSANLQDVVMGLAKEAGLNLVFEKGVDPMTPVSIEVSNLSLRKALDLLFSSYDYFYVIEGNTLRVKAMETRFFKFEFPMFSNSSTSSVGGDVLGGSSSNSSITGEFTVETESDDEAIKVWEQIKKALAPAAESGGGQGGGLLTENGRAQIDPMTGTIVVTDRRDNLDVVQQYLEKIEASVRRQVIIEARILEVTLNDEHQLGIDWTAVDSDTSITQSLSTGVGALNFLTTGKSATFFLEALSSQGEVHVLSSPRVNVLNNQSAVLSVGTTIPYLEWEIEEGADGATRAVPTVQQAQEGISLGVTPQISEDGMVTLHIVPVVTDQAGEETFTFEGNTFGVPVINVRSTDSIIQADNGQTVVIAGLIQERSIETVTGIPLLKDIPFFGYLFSSRGSTKSRVELVISLTPTIVKQ